MEKEIKDKKIPLKPLTYNMPLTFTLPKGEYGNLNILDENGEPFYLRNNFFDVTIPSFLPKEDLLIPLSIRKHIKTLRPWFDEKSLEAMKERKAVLGDILKLRYDENEILGNEIKHTHPKFQPWKHQTLDAYALKYSTNMLITHEVRVGKTITAVLGAYNNPYVKKVLVVCPKIVVEDAWVRTFKDWTNWSVATYTAVTSKKDKAERDANFESWVKGDINVLVVNIDFFKINKDKFMNIDIQNQEDLMIIDEAHFLTKWEYRKNKFFLSSDKAKAILAYRKQQGKKFLWLLTGTPATRNEYDILALFYLLSPTSIVEENRFGKPVEGSNNYKEFFNRFMNVTVWPAPENMYTFKVEKKEKYDRALEELNSLHRIHRNQADLWGSRDKFNIFKDVDVKNTPTQRAFMRAFKDGIGTELFLEAENPLVKLIFLRRIAVDPRALVPTIEKNLYKLAMHEDLEYKINAFEELTGEKVAEDTDFFQLADEVLDAIVDAYKLKKPGAKAEYILNYIGENIEQIAGNGREDSINIAEAERQILENNITDEEEKTVLRRTHQLKGRQPIIVFSFFTSFLKILKADIELKYPNLRVELICGETKDYQDLVDDFQAGKIDVLLGNSIKLKEGVTLNRADVSIFTDRLLEAENLQQVVARIQKPSTPYVTETLFLMAENSVDHHIKELVETKINNTTDVNKHAVNNAHNISDEVVNKLFAEIFG